MNIDIFNEYKEIDLQIIESIKEDREDETLFEKREEAIKNIYIHKSSSFLIVTLN